ncbi:spore germination protein [Alkalicella caledoniensis]|uniref:Spore germination protein n=1 Tax=Alkalicella caledoniensis TaxID=2731377 RepID=A0A7G9W7T6_ALKCA|nr:spore germination protein [Alkalicella caledoniensis]QNO14748.1 spore germination protein [Alkalicella caledoniensis]
MKPTMLNLIKRSLSKYLKTHKENKSSDSTMSEEEDTTVFTNNLDRNVTIIKSKLKDSDDVVYRDFQITATDPPLKGAIIFIDSLVDGRALESSVILPLTQGLMDAPLLGRTISKGSPQLLLESFLINSNFSYQSTIKDALNTIVSGNGILLLEGFPKAVQVSITKPPPKNSADPKSEKVIKGPQQGFVEDITVNIYALRKRIKSPNLAVKEIKLGRETDTHIKVVYLKNIADMSIVDELFKRLKRIDENGLFGAATIEDYISDSPVNLFNTTFTTERPDRVQAMLLEGRIALFVDGTPFVNIVPSIISDFFISTEDYNINYYFATFNRFLGYFGAFIVLFLPPVYIAVVTYHQEMIPTTLALTIAGTRAGVPFPAFVEALFMEIAFEALREAGTRLPTQVGQAVSIVGALIIGQAAVEAGLVSPAVVIVVATTAIFSFAMPYNNLVLSFRLSRFAIMILAAILGIYGIMTGALMILLTLISLRSFGVPFMTPFAPLTPTDMKDWVFRYPQWSIRNRSSQIVKENVKKKASNLKPMPPVKKEEE